MENLNKYEVNLWEDEIEWDESGKIIHHPLNGRYSTLTGRDRNSYGHLTFGGHNLDVSSKLSEVRVFYLEFTGEREEIYDREEWADPLRLEVLSRLSDTNRSWYLSMIDGPVEEIQDNLSRTMGVEVHQVIVESEKPYGYTYGFIPRPFFEIPNVFLPKVVPYFWSKAVPGYPIEGYNMAPGQIDLLKQWNMRPRDDQLFREMCDQTFINFYTFPAEHRYFVFVTNKLNYEELANHIDIKDLQARALKMGER